MPTIRRSLSNAANVALVGFLLAGCGPGMKSAIHVTEPQVAQTAMDQQPSQATQGAVQRSDETVTPAKSQGSDGHAQALATRPSGSHWCRYLQEDAAAESTVLRSPSVSGGVDDGGKANLSVAVSMSSFRKAELIERSAEAKCRHYLAEKGIQKLVFTSPQGLTAAGYRAKSDTIMASMGEVAEMRARIAAALAAGDIDRNKSSMLNLAADQLLAAASQARAQADMRLDALTGRPEAVRALSEQLMRAESDLAKISSEIRTSDAVDVSLSGGWRDEVDDNGFDAASDDFSGKLSFSVKLGAASPTRFEHERAARDARVSAIREEEGGSLWQVALLRKAHERALEGLDQSRASLDSAIGEAQSLVREVQSEGDMAMKDQVIAARLQLIALRADRAAVVASVKEIQSNLKRLAQD